MKSPLLTEGHYVIAGKLSAFPALHVARKLAPAMPTLERVLAKENAEKDLTVVIIMLMAQLSDADSEYVVQTCLNCVRRTAPGVPPAAVMSPQGVPMFADMNLSAMLELTVAVIEDSLGDFFATALAGLVPLGAEPKAPSS